MANYIKTTPPFIHVGSKGTTPMLRMLLCLGSLLVCTVFFYGVRMLISATVSILTCLFCEFIVSRIAQLPNTVGDFSAMVTALIIVLLLPATVPLWLIMLLDAFAILVAKAVFGGLGHNPFNPAACALMLGSVCWRDYVFVYPSAPQIIPVFGSTDLVTYAASPLSYIRNGGTPPYRIADMIFGSVPAAAGTGFCLLIIACAIYLIFTRTVRWRTTLSFLSAFVLLSVLFPSTPGVWLSAFYEVFSGYLLFAAVFMLTDPSTSPKSGWGCCIYGALCAVGVVMLRRYGVYEEGLCFALVAANALSPAFDRWVTLAYKRRLSRIEREKKSAKRPAQ